MRDLASGQYEHLHTLNDLRQVLSSGGDSVGDMMQRLNPAVWVPAVRVLGMQKIPDMLIVMSISLAGLFVGCLLLYLTLRFCLGSRNHPTLQVAVHTRSNVVHVIALSLKILSIAAGFFIALGTVGIDPINVALSVGVVTAVIGLAFQRVGNQVAATYTVTGGGLLAEGMVLVVSTRIGIAIAEVVAIGMYNTLLQGVLIGPIGQVLGLKSPEEVSNGKDLDKEMMFYVPNSEFVDGSWGRLPRKEDDVTSTGEGKPEAPPMTLSRAVDPDSIGSGLWPLEWLRTTTASGKPSMLKKGRTIRIPRKTQ